MTFSKAILNISTDEAQPESTPFIDEEDEEEGPALACGGCGGTVFFADVQVQGTAWATAEANTYRALDSNDVDGIDIDLEAPLNPSSEWQVNEVVDVEEWQCRDCGNMLREPTATGHMTDRIYHEL